MDELKKYDELLEKGMGYIEDEYNPKTFLGSAFLGEVELPKDFVLETPFTTSQGNLPSCTAHAVTSAKYFHENVRLSPRFNFAWSKYNDGYQGWGTTFENALNVLVKVGGAMEDAYPDEHMDESAYTDVTRIPKIVQDSAYIYKAKAYVRYDRSVSNMMQALYQHKAPLLAGLPWYQSYNRTPQDGFLPDMSGNSAGHAVQFIGWKNYGETLLFKNSFGSWFGDNGKFYLYKEAVNRLFGSVYGIIDMDVEEAKQIDAEYKKKNNITMDLRLLLNKGFGAVRDTDTGAFYVNKGDKLLEVESPTPDATPEELARIAHRAALASLSILDRADGKPVRFQRVPTDYLRGLIIEKF
jgi:hypothetical protein